MIFMTNAIINDKADTGNKDEAMEDEDDNNNDDIMPKNSDVA